MASLPLAITALLVFQATHLIHGHMTFWITDLTYSPLQSRQRMIWSDVGNGMCLDIFTIMRWLVSFYY